MEEHWTVRGAENTGEPRSGRVIVHVDGADVSTTALDVGVALSVGTSAELVLAQAELHSARTPLVPPEEALDASKSHLEAVADDLRTEYEGPLSAVVRTGHSLGALLNAVADGDANFVVLDADETAVSGVVSAIECDVVTVHNEMEMSRVQSVLVPVAGGPHSEVAARVAGAVARYAGGWVELLHVLDPDASAEERRSAEAMLAELSTSPGIDDVDTRTLVEPDAADAIVEQSAYYDCTVMGAPTKSRLARFAFGSTTDSVRAGAEGLVLTAWDRSRRRHGTLRPLIEEMRTELI